MANIIISTEIDGEYVDVGDLLFTAGRHDSHTARFTYDTGFIRRGWPIDPALRLDHAPHDLPGLPLAVEDAAPDSWGQMLLQRGERHAAEDQRRDSRKLTPDLFLLAASDATRQGALRFRADQNGPFLAQDARIPKTLELFDLLAAADAAAADRAGSDWAPIEQLLDAGSSALGGARPKAAVLDESGALWLAKFPQGRREQQRAGVGDDRARHR
jgi:serine/threonine-protein kinase HipA